MTTFISYLASVAAFLLVSFYAPLAKAEAPPKRVAAIVTAYYHNSHADLIVSRLLQTDTLDGKGKSPQIKLASIYTDQKPKNDISRKLAKRYGVSVYDNVADALTLGTGRLAVDGVLLIAEHGDYPRSKTGQVRYPKRRLFEQIVKVFQTSGRVAPVFIDKHLADTWEDAKSIYDASRKMKIPLMAGSSLPVAWRYPAMDLKRGTKLKEIVAISYHTLDAYGFHALEIVQAIAERRHGGETGIESVQCLVDGAVWEAGKRKAYDPKLLQAALQRLKRPPPANRRLPDLVPHPVLWIIRYTDGLKASVLTLNGAVGEWSVAWREENGSTRSTLFWTQEARPFMHFTYLVQGVGRMMQTGEATWPVERTLMTSGLLDALLISKRQSGKRMKTPELKFAYQTNWNWRQPPPSPPGRPIDGP